MTDDSARTVTPGKAANVADLEALPDGTVLRSRTGTLAKVGKCLDDRVIWDEGWSTFADAIQHRGPYEVLWRPDRQPRTVTRAEVEKAAQAIWRGYVGDSLSGWEKHAYSYDREKAEYVARAVLAAVGITVEEGP